MLFCHPVLASKRKRMKRRRRGSRKRRSRRKRRRRTSWIIEHVKSFDCKLR